MAGVGGLSLRTMPTAAEPLCLHCCQPLNALTRRRGQRHCDRSACRAQADLAELAQRWHRVDQAAQRQAAAATGDPALPLLHLRSSARRLVPVDDALRRWLTARWCRAWAEGELAPSTGQGAEADTTALPPEATALCAHCAGHCCTHGAASGAFIDAALLQRWLDAHPGATLDEAIADHLALLPAQHVEGQCAYQGAAGCALPRERRAELCNVYRCEALDTLAAALARQPDAAAVVLTRAGRRLEQAVIFRHGHATPLAGVPQPDELGTPPPPAPPA